MRRHLSLAVASVGAVLVAAVAVGSCSANSSDVSFTPGGGGSGPKDGSAGGWSGSSGSGQPDVLVFLDSTDESCQAGCSADYKSVVGCNGTATKVCGDDELCANSVCKPACEAVKDNRSSVGCEYYPVAMTGYGGADNGCLAVFVANTWGTPAHISISHAGSDLNPSAFGRLPDGTGAGLTYEPFDSSAGIPPGQVAIFFLQGQAGGTSGGVACPDGIPVAVPEGAQVKGTGIGNAFHLTSDVPVVAYQMLPYGGGSAAVTGASLLLPTSAWHTNYVAVNAYEQSAAAGTNPTLNLVAMTDATEITLLPKVAVVGGAGVPAGPANTPLKLTLNRGQQVQITQPAELTGSPIESTQPIGLMAGHECLNVPAGASYCDHAEQQIPPVRALGSEYACVTHRQRAAKAENPPWRIIGAVPGTQLKFDPPSIHADAMITLGDVIEFATPQPFVVRSQDAEHPFLVTTYMTGSTTVQEGYGDADFVRIVPSGQYLNRYVFFTDPTYPESNLVVVRKKDANGEFRDVELDCEGVLSGWQALGSTSIYEFTRTDLIRHDFQGQHGCSNGRHEMKSAASFGLWVWGWGTPETTIFTKNVSYGYPAGENVLQINEVYVPPVPK